MDEEDGRKEKEEKEEGKGEEEDKEEGRRKNVHRELLPVSPAQIMLCSNTFSPK